MKKAIAIIITSTMILSMTGCTFLQKKEEREKPGDKTISSTDIDCLQTLDGPMITVSTCSGFYDPSVDCCASYSYTVDYDGTITLTDNYTLSGTQVHTDTISDNDYMDLYWFGHNTAKNNPYEDYYEEVCDGQTWSFTFYDEDGVQHDLYDGYTYNNDDLIRIQQIVAGYCNK